MWMIACILEMVIEKTRPKTAPIPLLCSHRRITRSFRIYMQHHEESAESPSQLHARSILKISYSKVTQQIHLFLSSRNLLASKKFDQIDYSAVAIQGGLDKRHVAKCSFRISQSKAIILPSDRVEETL